MAVIPPAVCNCGRAMHVFAGNPYYSYCKHCDRSEPEGTTK